MSRNVVLSERQSNDANVTRIERNNKMRTKNSDKCSTIENGLKLASWLNGVSDDPSESLLSSSNEYLLKHLASNCTCVHETHVELIIGCNFYQLFLLRLKQFNCNVSVQESRLSVDDGMNEENSTKLTDSIGTTTSPYSNADADKPSKYKNEIFGHIVNKNSCEKIINPLKTAVHYWEKAIKSKKSTDPNTLSKLSIAFNLISCYYVFETFDVLNYKYRSATLLLSVSHLVKLPNLQLHAYYLMIQACIQSGAVEKAKSFLKKAEVVLSTFSLKKTFETSLIFLAQCEIGLYSGNAELYAKELKHFIDSDYLQTMTLNRYYLKGLAIALAAKFPSNVYQFSETFQEFTELMAISICILKRWHRCYFPVAADLKKKDDDMSNVDPVWYKFATYDFSLKAYKTVSLFYINSGTPVDIAFFHNALLKIGRRNCFLLWIVRLLISAAEIDLLCDKKESAVIKLNVAAAMYVNISNYTISDSGSCDSNDDIICRNMKFNSWGGFRSTDLDTENAEITASPNQNLSYTEEECSHDHMISVRCLRNMLLKNGNERLCDFDSNSDEVFLKSGEHSNIADEKDDGFIRFNFLKHEVYLCLTLFQDSWKNCLTDRLEELHSKFTEHIANSYVTKLADAIGVDCGEIEKSFFSIDSSIVHLKLLNYLSDACLKSGNFSKIVNISEALLQNSKSFLFGIEMKTLFASLIFKYAKAKFTLFNKQSLIIEYNVYGMEEMCNSEIKSVCKTPSPNRGKNKQLAPKAPRGKNEFKMDEFKEYLDALAKIPQKKSNVKRPQTSIFDNKRKTRIDSKPKESIASENSGDIDDILKIDAIYSARKASCKRTTLRSISKSNEVTKVESKSRSKSITSYEAGISCDNTENNILFGSHSTKSEYFTFTNISCFEDIQSTLLNLLRLFGNHPPCQLYRDVHFLLFQITTVKNCNENTAHHFSEATTASSIRYRNILLSEKKKKNSITPSLDLKSFAFNPAVDTNSDFFQRCLSDLPSSWRICQLHAISNNTAIPDIYVARYQMGKKPLFFKIKGNSEIFLQDFMSELYQIIELSNASISNKDVATFWKVRYALDTRFKVLMNGVDDMWFGPFKGLFMGQVLDKTFCEMCSEIKSKILQLFKKMTCKDESLLDMIIESYALLTNEQLLFSIITLFGDKMIAKMCIMECEKIFHRYYPIDEKSTIFENLKTEPVALIVNKPLAAFPFEALPTPVMLKQEIFRVPSVRFLSILYKSFTSQNSMFCRGIDPKSVYYLLNPANNLPKTDQYFKEKFLKQSDWNGVIGSPPNAMELKKFLQSRDLYIFFGHGAGTVYYRSLPDGLEGTEVKSASVVIGCCSGKLISDGECFEPYGVPWRFIMNGSPSYLGILWDVTDRDIDRFADRLLQNFLPNWADTNKWQPQSICNAVVRSRDACRLKYLIGASPVVYGLPISVINSK